MARKVFFSFHYERDAQRAGVVRNSGITKENYNEAGFLDAVDREKVKKGGNDAIEKRINDQLNGTSVTVVLIGKETESRPWVKYELKQSWKKGNGILGVYIHNIKDFNGDKDSKGKTTFGDIFTSPYDDKKYFYERFKCYDRVDDEGYKNFGKRIEQAAKDSGR